jgi:hypothetical protein
MWKHKRPWIAKQVWEKNPMLEVSIPNFKLYYRPIKIKTSWYWHKNRHEDQRIRIKDRDINSDSYSQLIVNKGSQSTQWRKDSLFNKCCWENWISTCRRLKLDLCLSPYTNINSKWITDLNINPEMLKQLQEVVGNTLEQIGIGNDFLSRTQMAQYLRERMNKWDCTKLKKLLHSKRNSH